jgi:hypothetical protein
VNLDGLCSDYCSDSIETQAQCKDELGYPEVPPPPAPEFKRRPRPALSEFKRIRCQCEQFCVYRSEGSSQYCVYCEPANVTPGIGCSCFCIGCEPDSDSCKSSRDRLGGTTPTYTSGDGHTPRIHVDSQVHHFSRYTDRQGQTHIVRRPPLYDMLK